MPRSFNQKLKILYLMKLLQEKTDREHPVSVKDIIQTMEAYGISVERKTVYDDIETLRTFGMKIGSRRGKPAGFYLEERTFELLSLNSSWMQCSPRSLLQRSNQLLLCVNWRILPVFMKRRS